jgi:cell division protein FtsB
VKKIIKRIWEYIRSNPKSFFFRVAFALFVFWMLFDDYGIVKRIRMEAEHRMLLDRQKAEQQKIIDNEQRIRYALEPDSIEKAARERYNFRKPGETLFIIREQ